MKILIIDDNTRLAERIKQQLGKKFVIDIVTSGARGLQQALAVNYSIIILDLGLPDMHGLAVCNMLRERHVDAPVLVLTAVEDMDTKVALLESGADDYLIKPFNISELRARIKALLRRPSPRPDNVQIAIEDLEIDMSARAVKRENKNIKLRRKEFDILEYLIQNRGRPVTRQMILEHVWEEGTSSWHNTVDVHIKHLRDKLDKPFKKKFIKTAYGVGYMFKD